MKRRIQLFYKNKTESTAFKKTVIRKLFVFKVFTLGYLILGSISGSAESSDSIKNMGHFAGIVTVSSKGLSTFPNLTLGKPAAILDLSMGGEKFRFEPLFRFALEGKPWSFILWSRYQLYNSDKVSLRIGAHPSYSFKSVSVEENGNLKQILRVRQFLGIDVFPNFKVAKNITFGPYYIYSRGIESDIVRNSNFFSLRANLSNIRVSDNYFFKFLPQLYYLKMDKNDGLYLNSTLVLASKKVPFSVSSTLNKAFKSTLEGEKFLWNINLIYSFANRYKKI